VLFDPYAGPEPVIVLLEANPWLTVIGSDTPALVVYDNRCAIQLRAATSGGEAEYVAQTLDERTYAGLLDRMSLLNAGSRIRQHYDAAPGVYDLSTTSVFVRAGAASVTTSIYGLDFSRPKGFDVDRFSAASAQVPTVVRALISKLRTLNLPGAKPWKPQYLEVMFWPYEYAPDPSINWPARWPGFQSKWSKTRGNDSHSIYLPGSEVDALRGFLSSGKPRGAIALAGKKWAVAWRFVFPHEPVWRKPFVSNER
jgi:hypothetical protein